MPIHSAPASLIPSAAFWLLSRAEYDTLLPIDIAPRPREIVRVGLVIEDLEP
jgi:hypothetical protein